MKLFLLLISLQLGVIFLSYLGSPLGLALAGMASVLVLSLYKKLEH